MEDPWLRYLLAAIELLAYFLEEKGLWDTYLLIHSDNQGTIGTLGKGCSPNTYINLSVHCIHLVLVDLFITPNFTYIESGANPADPISHGESGPASRHIFPTFVLLEELIDCFINVES